MISTELKTRFRLLVQSAIILYFVPFASTSISATTDIAVVPLEAKSGVDASVADLITGMLRTELYNTSQFDIMNREDMNAILKEIAFQQSGSCDQKTCLVEMGQALGVRKMVAGSVGIIQNNYIINVKLINVEELKNEILLTETHPISSKQNLREKVEIVALEIADAHAKAGVKKRKKHPLQRIAVVNLKTQKGVSRSTAELLSDILRTELYRTERFEVMNREDMGLILKEIAFQQSGACDMACVVEMGQALGVDRIVAGTIGIVQDDYVINAGLVNVSKLKNERLLQHR